MNMVSSFIGSISPEMFGGNIKSATQNIDLEDTTFSDMLEKQINKEMQQNKLNLTNNFSLQSGINIGDFDGSQPQFTIKTNNSSENSFEAIKPINEFDKSTFKNMNNAHDKSTSEVVTFFNSLFDSKPTLTDTSSSGLFDFERKIAASRYNKYAKNIITDLSEFVTDTMKIKS